MTTTNNNLLFKTFETELLSNWPETRIHTQSASPLSDAEAYLKEFSASDWSCLIDFRDRLSSGCYIPPNPLEQASSRARREIYKRIALANDQRDEQGKPCAAWGKAHYLKPDQQTHLRQALEDLIHFGQKESLIPNTALSSSAASSSSSSSAASSSEEDAYRLEPVTIRCRLEPHQRLFVRGNGGGLSQDKGIALVRFEQDQWVAPIPHSETRSYEWSLWEDDLRLLSPESWDTISPDPFSSPSAKFLSMLGLPSEIWSSIPRASLAVNSPFIFYQINGSYHFYERLSNIPSAQKIIDSTSCPEHLRTWITDKILLNPIPITLIEQVCLPKILQPKLLLLKSIAEHYLLKYGIEIRILSFSEFKSLIQSSPVFPKPFGIIVTQDDKNQADLGHVVPVILNFSKDLREVLILDSVGGWSVGKDSHPYSVAIRQFLNTEGISPLFSETLRQADNYSCRTDALVVLRNALLDLKLTKVSTLREKLIEDCPVVGVKKELLAYLVHPPLQWDYTNQISNKKEGARTAFVVRDFFSRSEQKRRSPRTVEQFRAQYREKVGIHMRLEMPLIDGLELPQDIAPCYFNQEDGVGKNATMLHLFDTKWINTYLVRKGLKNAVKFRPPN